MTINGWAAVVLLITSSFSLYFLYRLYSRPCHWFGRLALTLLLLVPFIGWFAYLFVVEDVPPQYDDLKDTGPRGFYTGRMISRARRDKPQDDEP